MASGAGRLELVGPIASALAFALAVLVDAASGEQPRRSLMLDSVALSDGEAGGHGVDTTKKTRTQPESQVRVFVVAGVGLEPTTFGL